MAETWSCFVPPEVVPWGDAEAALATSVHSERIDALPRCQSIRIIPLAAVYLAGKTDFKLFPAYSQSSFPLKCSSCDVFQVL